MHLVLASPLPKGVAPIALHRRSHRSAIVDEISGASDLWHYATRAACN